MPDPNFCVSAKMQTDLDLLTSAVTAGVALSALRNPPKEDEKIPSYVKMWLGHENALLSYLVTCHSELKRRKVDEIENIDSSVVFNLSLGIEPNSDNAPSWTHYSWINESHQKFMDSNDTGLLKFPF